MKLNKWIIAGIVTLISFISSYYLYGWESCIKITLVLSIAIIGFESGITEAYKPKKKKVK